MPWRLIFALFIISITKSYSQINQFDRQDPYSRDQPNQFDRNNPLNSPNPLNPLHPNEFNNPQVNQFGGGTNLNQPDYGTQNYAGGGQQNFNYNTYGNSIEGIDINHYCPEHWLAYRNTCFRFIRSPKRNWFHGKKICQAYSADLANIDTLEKHSFIMKELIVQNQKQNRYFISAKQTSYNNWVNDDNTQLIQLDDGFAYEDTAAEKDLLNSQFRNEDSNFARNNNNQNFNLNQNLNNQNNNKNRYNQGKTPNNPFANPNYEKMLAKDRLVYGFSRQKGRWVFIPTYDYEENLFICESTTLYNQNNINIIADDKRTYEYGQDIVDVRKITRGPFFIRQPVDTTYDTGKSKYVNDVSLRCLAGGFPTPSYTWYKEEFVNDNLTFFLIDPILDGQYTISGGNLIITDPKQTKHQGTYHCVAENKFGRIISESVELNFGYIMEFNLKRSAESGDMNWGKSLFCDPPQHFPGVKYYWSRDFFPNFVQEDQRVFVSSDGALYFSALETVDRANYSCTVQSLVSATGRNGPFFELRVKPHPNYQALIFANSFPKVFPEAPIAGEEIRLECMAFGYPVPSYNWTRLEGGLPRHARLESYNRILIVPNATINDNGDYQCTVRNDRKSLSKTITINIQMRPNFTIPLRDKIKDFNSEVNFICEANAIPDVNYTWYKNGNLLERETMDKDKYIIQDNVLTIKYLDPDKDNGMYQCKAKNQLRGAYTSGQLRVLSMKPSFKKYPLESEIYAIYNGNTTIECKPEAAPRPKFQWKKDGNIIGAGGHRRILPGGTLIISPTSRDDEGVYACVATNSYGTDESRARVIVLRKFFLDSILFENFNDDFFFYRGITFY